MQRRPQGSACRSAQRTHGNVARFDRYEYDRQHVPPRKDSRSVRGAKSVKRNNSFFRKILLGKNRAGQTPAWRIVAIDVLVFALSLVSFAFFHHGMPRSEEAVGITSSRDSMQQRTVQVSDAVQTVTSAPTSAPTSVPTAVPAAAAETVSVIAVDASSAPVFTATPAPTAVPTSTPEPEPIGYFGTKYADKFTDGKVISNGTSYKSANVNVTATKLREMDSDVYFVDVYVKDISCFRTEFAEGRFGRSLSEWPVDVAKRIGSVVAINGDYYGARNDGIVIRNGILYRDDETDRDVGVIYWDGTMKCFTPREFNAEAEMAKGAYQAWNFGPMLLDENGRAKTSFNSSVGPANPRAAIGYFEPGHYCLVVVDGRSNASHGLTLEDLSAFFERIGCAAAYNLDGGATAAMVCGTEMVNNPSARGRECSDFVVIVDEIIAGF